MNSTTRLTLTGAAILAITFVAGCFASAPPTKTIANAEYVGDQSVRYLTSKVTVAVSGGDQPSGQGSDTGGPSKSSSNSDSSSSEEGGYFFDLSVEVCDLTDSRDETNCATTMVLGNATLGSFNYANQIRESRLTNMFWYDEKTLYVAYMRQGKTGQGGFMTSDTSVEAIPQVKKCRVQSNNSLSCAPTQDLNNQLFKKETVKTGPAANKDG